MKYLKRREGRGEKTKDEYDKKFRSAIHKERLKVSLPVLSCSFY